MANQINPYTYKSPRATCVNCGDRIVKLDEFHDDDWWRHEHNNSHRCPFSDVVLYALPATPKRIGQFSVGSTVYWHGQQGECSGKVILITRPENSGYVLVVENDGNETYHPVTTVSLEPPMMVTCKECRTRFSLHTHTVCPSCFRWPKEKSEK